MRISELVEAASLLIPFLEGVRSALRQWRHERRAALNPATVKADQLDAAFDDTLARLRGTGSLDTAWWEQLVDWAGHTFIAPDLLEKPAVQTWLRDEEVGTDAKALARERLIGGSQDDEARLGRLARKYSDATGEDQRYAQVPIEIVLAVLIAGYLAPLDSALTRVVGIMQASDRATRATVREVGGALSAQLSQLGPDAHVARVHSELALTELAHIRKRRALAPERVRVEILALLERMSSGDLRGVDTTTRSEALYWAARLLAHQPEQLAGARAYLAELRRIDAHADTRIVEALILEREGNPDAAIHIVRDIEDPDGRSTLLAMLLRTRGQETALAWFDARADRDDPNYLTGFGWALVLPVLAEAGRWSEAQQRAAAVVSRHVEECPNLVMIDAVLNTAMLLPDEHKLDVLRMNVFHPSIRTVEGGDTQEYRTRAHEQFGLAERLLTQIGEERPAGSARVFQLWLQLTDPRPDIAQATRKEVEEGLQDGTTAIELLPVAYTFGIGFNAEPIRRYLAQRATLGGLNEREMNAEFLLAKMTMSGRDFAAYVEREELRLRQALPSATLAGIRIEALVADGQTARARQLLEERRADFGDDYDRLDAFVTNHEGGDPRATLERLYRETNSLLDLRNLIEHLYQVQDWRGLCPLLEELFRREPTSENALRLIGCMTRDPSAGQGNIAAFFDAHEEVATWSHALASAKAWSFFYMGRLREARSINNVLLAARSDPADLHLDINLALQSGDWERFPAIVEREWDRRHTHTPEVLLRLGILAAEVDRHSTRAYELATLAAERGVDDPRALINAYMLTVQLGKEGEREAGWMMRAAELSTEGGPVWRLDLRAMAEGIPARRERVLRILDGLRQGEFPIHAAATAMSVPLSRFMIDIPRWNRDRFDGRECTVIPIVSGAHPTVPLDSTWIVGLDITTVMVLGQLGLLDLVCRTFRRIVLAPAVMTVLLDERRRARFHQPQRVREADELRGLVNDDSLTVIAPPLPVPPTWLVKEVGRDLSELLVKAHSEHAMVVHPRPFYRIGAFLEQEADLRQYDSVVLSTTALVHLLYSRGYVDQDAYEKARRYLSLHDHGEERADPQILGRPVFLDSLAVTYLQHVGVLTIAARAHIPLYVHPSLQSELDALAAANREGDRLAESVDSIRLSLRAAIAEERVGFLPRSAGQGEEIGAEAVLTHFVQNAGSCDAVCIDDRFANTYAGLTDSSGRTVPLACVLDVLSHPATTGIIDESRRRDALHHLRELGFGLLPLQPGELGGAIRAAQCDADGQVVETAELRILRQRLMRIRALGMVSLPREESFLQSYHRECMSEILRLWKDEAVSVERVIGFCDWIWQNLVPSPFDWVKATEQIQKEHQAEIFARQVSSLVWLVAALPENRRDAFRTWVQLSVLDPLLPANPELVDAVSSIVADNIARLVERIQNGSTERSS